MELTAANKFTLIRKIGSGSFGDIFIGESLEHFAKAIIVRFAKNQPILYKIADMVTNKNK
jgi:hypothetical protein